MELQLGRDGRHGADGRIRTGRTDRCRVGLRRDGHRERRAVEVGCDDVDTLRTERRQHVPRILGGRGLTQILLRRLLEITRDGGGQLARKRLGLSLEELRCVVAHVRRMPR